MNPHDAYQQQRANGLTRIDMLLALYDGAILRLEEAARLIAGADQSAAMQLVLRSERIVAELIAGLDLGRGEVALNLKRLYEFALHRMADGSVGGIQDALQVLRVLRDAWATARPEAIELEHSGVIPPLDEVQVVRASA